MARSRDISKVFSADTSLVTTSELNSALSSIDLSSTIVTASSAAVSALINGAPAALDTLNELSAALNNDQNFATTITNQLAQKLNISTASATYLPLTGGTISGNLQVSGSSTFTGIIKNTNIPAFQAYGSTTSPTANNTDWIFPFTYVNNGNHYNTSNGRFTAPINGLYVFFWSNIGNTTNTIYRYRIRKNGVNIDDLHLRLAEGYAGGYRDNGDKKALLQLNAGDYINIFYQSDGSIASYSDQQYPWFGGYLIA